jgi:DNA-binding IclR family transcriptional regulator
MGQFDQEIDSHETGVLQRMCAILDCFDQESPTLGVREIARITGFSSSTTGRLLQRMKNQRLLRQDPVTREYALGMRLLNWAGVFLTSLDIRSVAMPVMVDLLSATRETISLYLRDGLERVCVERLESPQNVRIIARLGLRLPLHAGSAGKVMLAFLPQEIQEAVYLDKDLKVFTDRTITDRSVLIAELEQIRRQGYATSHGEWIADASGVAAPVFSGSELIGAVTISGPSQRFTPERVAEYARLVVQAGSTISEELGFNPVSSPSGSRKAL